MKTTIRIEKVDGTYLEAPCVAQDKAGCIELEVPAFHGVWLIQPGGMLANIGGSDWRIYNLHPDDCKRICSELKTEESAYLQAQKCPTCGHDLKEITGNDSQLECDCCDVLWAKYVVGGAK